MNYKNSAQQIYELLGGENNIKSLTHCMTRLRLVLKDESKVEDEKVKAVPGVIGVMKKGGQYQIIMGNDVANYYKELLKLGNFEVPTEENIKEKKGILETLIDVISSCMSPILPALIGGGIIKVLLIVLPMINLLNEGSSTFAVLSFFGDAPFYFLPIMLAYTAAQKFKVSPMLAVTIAGIMIHPNFVAAISEGNPLDIFGLPITLATYSSSVIPIVIMVWLMSYIENICDKYIPATVKSFLKPFLIILVSGIIALVVVGPLGTFAGNGLSSLILWIYSKAGWLALGLMTAFMPLIVMTGMHWAFAPIFLIASAATPDVLILPAMLVANIAQGAAALSVSIKTKDKNLKQIGFVAGISALVAGVTEPALYGITLKYKKPLYVTIAVGAACGIYMGIAGMAAYSFAVPSVLTLPQFVGGEGNTSIITAVILSIVSFVATFILTWIVGIDEESKEESVVIEGSDSVEAGSYDPKKVYSPITGEVVPLDKVNDSAFSTKMMGEGIAVLPTDGMVVAPFDGKVAVLFPTKHAIGLESVSGIELLIHVGIDTVELNGQYFEALVSAGDVIRKGQPLLKVDFEKIKEAGYDIVTPIVVTNTSNFVEVVAKDSMQDASNNTPILYVV